MEKKGEKKREKRERKERIKGLCQLVFLIRGAITSVAEFYIQFGGFLC